MVDYFLGGPIFFNFLFNFYFIFPIFLPRMGGGTGPHAPPCVRPYLDITSLKCYQLLYRSTDFVQILPDNLELMQEEQVQSSYRYSHFYFLMISRKSLREENIFPPRGEPLILASWGAGSKTTLPRFRTWPKKKHWRGGEGHVRSLRLFFFLHELLTERRYSHAPGLIVFSLSRHIECHAFYLF